MAIKNDQFSQHNMASGSSELDVGNLFRVEGIVAVVTGGGTGEYFCTYLVLLRYTRCTPRGDPLPKLDVTTS
jgi:hypothetical protein